MNNKLKETIVHTLSIIPGITTVHFRPAYIVQNDRKMLVYYGKTGYHCTYDRPQFQIFFTLIASQKIGQPESKIQIDLKPQTVIDLSKPEVASFWRAVLGYTSFDDQGLQKAENGFINFDFLNDLTAVVGSSVQILSDFKTVSAKGEHTNFPNRDEDPYDGYQPHKYYGLPKNQTGKDIQRFLDAFNKMDCLHQEVDAKTSHDLENLKEVDLAYLDDEDIAPAFDILPKEFDKQMPKQVDYLFQRITALTDELNKANPKQPRFVFMPEDRVSLLRTIWKHFADPIRPRAIHNYMAVRCNFPNMLTFSMDTKGKVFLTAQSDRPINPDQLGNTKSEQFSLGYNFDVAEFARCCRHEIDYRYDNRGLRIESLREMNAMVDDVIF